MGRERRSCMPRAKPTVGDKNEPLGELHDNWRKVFPKIPGFESCLCLQGVRPPTRSGEMDFLLVNRNNPALGLVECEGRKSKVPAGIEQMLKYVNGFEQFSGDGKEILKQSIENALEGRLKRATEYNVDYGGVLGWISRWKPPLRSEEELRKLLSRASRKIVPVLLYFRYDSLAPEEEQVLRIAFKKHRLYAGTINSRNWILKGRYLR
ncbi:hypothetical protein ACFL2Z_00060 [Candidatus Eisenbacteria bacterium]|uniref:Uncharacterized protein n=1 Tax=Eiseniibacteriota bacterium TaxID=2212470 RepID=A0ABV6YMJ9_UNCEI